MRKDMFSRYQTIWVGAVYGIGLSILGIWAAGAGHGPYLLLGLSAAPFSAFGIKTAIAVQPFMWTAIWYYTSARTRKFFLVIICAHYASAIAVLKLTEFGDWDYLVKAWKAESPIVAAGLVWYSAGQILMWLAFRAGKYLQDKRRNPVSAL
jgi:hypothetical protein